MENPQTSKNVSTSADVEKQFMDALETFMEQCYKFIESHKEPQLPPMSEKERLAKIKQVTDLIQEKELELAKLQAERDNLSNISGQSQSKSAHQDFGCVEGCPADCKFRNETV